MYCARSASIKGGLTRRRNKDYAKAQFELAVMYHKGEGVAQNDEQAFKWYEKAAQQGLAEAQL